MACTEYKAFHRSITTASLGLVSDDGKEDGSVANRSSVRAEKINEKQQMKTK
jgi:hypothetical protein